MTITRGLAPGFMLLLLCAGGSTMSVDTLHAQSPNARCGEVRERARTIREVIDTSIGTPPLLRGWFGPRELAPVGDRGRTARYEARIDETGVPIASSVKLHGIMDVGFEGRLRRQLQKNRFEPARIDGCEVEGLVEIPFKILPNGGVNAPPMGRRTARGAETEVLPDIGPECADIRARARSKQLLDTEKLMPASARSMVLPPLPVPNQAKGKPLTFTVRVDSAGSMIDSTATLTAVEPKRYHRELLATLKKTSLRPARVGNCAVEGEYTITMTLGVTRP